MRTLFLAATMSGAAALSLAAATETSALTVTQQNAGNIFADATGANAWSSVGDTIYQNIAEPNVEGGMFRLVGDDGVNALFDFVAFCFEFSQFFANNVGYTPNTISDPTLMARVDALYSNAYDNVTDDLTAAAFQFALWEMSEDFVLGFDTGAFRLTATDDPALLTLADGWIQNIATGAWVGSGEWSFTVLNNPTTQDVILAERLIQPDPISSVPVPAGLVLIATALAGLGGLARRARSRSKMV